MNVIICTLGVIVTGSLITIVLQLRKLVTLIEWYGDQLLEHEHNKDIRSRY